LPRWVRQVPVHQVQRLPLARCRWDAARCRGQVAVVCRSRCCAARVVRCGAVKAWWWAGGCFADIQCWTCDMWRAIALCWWRPRRNCNYGHPSRHRRCHDHHVGYARALIVLRERSGYDIEGVWVEAGKMGYEAGHNSTYTSRASWVRALSKPHTFPLPHRLSLSNCCLLLLLLPCHPPVLPLLLSSLLTQQFCGRPRGPPPQAPPREVTKPNEEAHSWQSTNLGNQGAMGLRANKDVFKTRI